MRKYVFNVCLVALIIIFPIAVFSWWTEPIHGDLTRIGKWTERDFGPNATPQTIQVMETGENTKNADAFVLGDSFSEKNLWQSVLQKKNQISIQSFHYDRNCLTNWIDAAIADKSSKFIFIETVERNLIVRFSHMPKCRKTNTTPLEIQSGLADNKRSFWPLTTDISYLGSTAFNIALSFAKKENYSKRFMTVNLSLKKDCALLSNNRNDKLLYYADDDLKESWTDKDIKDSISNILEIQRAVEKSGKKFIFIIAPDKSTAYKKCMLTNETITDTKNINDTLISASINTPNMARKFQGKVNSIMDLYDPNNTHWSQAGYILAGETISRFLSER